MGILWHNILSAVPRIIMAVARIPGVEVRISANLSILNLLKGPPFTSLTVEGKIKLEDQ